MDPAECVSERADGALNFWPCRTAKTACCHEDTIATRATKASSIRRVLLKLTGCVLSKLPDLSHPRGNARIGASDDRKIKAFRAECGTVAPAPPQRDATAATPIPEGAGPPSRIERGRAADSRSVQPFLDPGEANTLVLGSLSENPV